MPIISRSALVPFSAKQMFLLVNSVEDYPRFLPWCAETTVLAKTDAELKATLIIQWSGLRKAFTTLNTLTPFEMMEIHLIDGPFRTLSGKWQFVQLKADACKVILDLDFEFTGNIIDKLFAPVFNHIANTLVDSFCKQARVVYGHN